MSWDWDKLQNQKNRQAPGGDIPPQINEIVDKVKKIKFPGGPMVILVIILLFFASSTFFTIGVDEVGVIQRFGKYNRTTQPGLNFKLPTGIEKVTKVKVERVYKEEFGFSSARSGRSSNYSSNQEDSNVSLMLTGDLNVGVVPWIVQYRTRPKTFSREK
jgi:modulator of FtsH protease HflK